ncbi:hypothetical protein J416_02504 [Gracilibacillus halophilus YIM-C55.5]|uniref:Uncharacterized protein n=1 Tax=Gracilibacillus halophilus YIM-C55.5 TaxID=1308866 RepID=N4WPE4_9BACI|nr:hypothetical protein [Gracilibacillus halophilus]ENH97987.1 hypothetical protein J416_02504 [Gracilibacillus halophilus YIM-C55.5]
MSNRHDHNRKNHKHNDCFPGINIVNDTDREVAIGKKGVAAGDFADVAVVGKNGAAAAGFTPEAAAVGKDGSAQVADPQSAQATNRGNAASQPQDRFNQGTESGRGDLNQDASQ